MWVVGVDENGLGPKLGPLVTTAMTIELRGRYQRARLWRRGAALGLGDSKEVSSFGQMAFAESVAWALVEHTTGKPAHNAQSLLEAVALHALQPLWAACPNAATAAQCWSGDIALPVFGGDRARGHALLHRLEGRSGLRLVRVRSATACPGVLNARAGHGQNKLQVNLRFFEELLREARVHAGADLEGVCGMVGGIRDYPAHMTLIEQAQLQRSRRGLREYCAAGLGRFRFEVSADARHLPVALASIVGKYVRELWMHRLHAFYAQHAEVPRASGYHDPVTKRFVEATTPIRRRLAIDSGCFERRA